MMPLDGLERIKYIVRNYIGSIISCKWRLHLLIRMIFTNRINTMDWVGIYLSAL